MQLLVINYTEWCCKNKEILGLFWIWGQGRRGEETPTEMQRSALNGKGETPDYTSSGSLKHFCFLAAVCYHPTMLSNQSRGSQILFPIEFFSVCGDGWETGFLIANFCKFYPSSWTHAKWFMQRLSQSIGLGSCYTNKGVVARKKDQAHTCGRFSTVWI